MKTQTNNTNLWIALVAIFIITVMITACATNAPTGNAVREKNNPEVSTAAPIKIGLSVPLSGEGATFGQNAAAGAKLAVSEINARGGISGRQVELIIEDDTCNAKSVAAVTKLITVDNVDGLIGPLCSSAAGPALPIAVDHNTPTILFSASAPKLTSLGTNIYRIYPSDSFHGSAGAEFMYNKLGVRKVAVLYVQNDWGAGLQDVFTKRFTELGGVVVYSSGVTQDNTDFKTTLLKIKESGAQGIYLPLYPVGAVPALKQIKELQLNLPIVSGDAFADDTIRTSGYADGVIYTLAKVDYLGSFDAKIKAVDGYQKLQVMIFAPLAYDGVMILADAMDRSGTTNADDVIAALAATKYAGVSSKLIEFNKRELNHVDFDYNTIKDKTVEAYKFSDAATMTSTTAKPIVTIALIGPFSGGLGFIGNGAKDATALALEQLPQTTKYQYKIVFEDDQMNAKNAVSALQKIMSTDKVDAVISMTSGPGNAISPIAAENGILHCAIASDPAIVSGSTSFLHWTTPEAESKVMVKALEYRGITKVAVITMNQQGMFALLAQFKSDIKGTNINLVSEEFYDGGEKDFKTSLLKIQNSGAEIIFIEGVSPEIELIAKQIKELDINIPITSVESTEYSQQPELFEGTWYIQAAEATPVFRTTYADKYGTDPKVGGPNAYDCFNLIVNAYETAGKNTDGKPDVSSVVNAFAQTKNFNGAMGILNVDPDRRVQSVAVVREVRNGTFVTIDG